MDFFKQTAIKKIPKLPLKILLKVGINKFGNVTNINFLKSDNPDTIGQIFDDLIVFGFSDGIVEPGYEWLVGRPSTLFENVAQQTGSQALLDFGLDMKYSRKSYAHNAIVEVGSEWIEAMQNYSTFRNMGVSKIMSAFEGNKPAETINKPQPVMPFVSNTNRL